MKERPILFSAPMIRAILTGTKSQTRRAVKLPKELAAGDLSRAWPDKLFGVTPGLHVPMSDEDESVQRLRNPWGWPEPSRLWVRETWKYADWTDDGYPWVRYAADDATILHEHISADWTERLNDIWAELSRAENYSIDNRAADRRWRSPIFMSRWASRITLEITAVRVERLQDISEADAIVEGIEQSEEFFNCPCWRGYGENTDVVFPDDPVGSYCSLWESINGPGVWETNPWVWVIEFRTVEERRA